VAIDPNARASSGVLSPGMRALIDQYMSDPLDFPFEFTQWVYAIVANPTFSPQVKGQATVAAPQTQTFTDSGHTDFFSQGTWVVEVQTVNSIIAGALVYCGTDTGGTNKTVVIIGSGVAGDGVSPTLSVQNNVSATAVFRVLTASATGNPVTVTYRRSTVTS